MKFEWDESNARTNLSKHGVDFVDAARIFDDHAASHAIDDMMEYGEERTEAIGIVDGIVLVVIYVERGERIRLISARKATRREEDDHFRERWAGPD
jgi:uncharacterized DUF497 family protein